jgi:hypothetical protein
VELKANPGSSHLLSVPQTSEFKHIVPAIPHACPSVPAALHVGVVPEESQ